MKIKTLLEMPVLIDKELNEPMSSFFIPAARLLDGYDEIDTDTNFQVYLKHDKTRAYMGSFGIRHDGVKGVAIIAEVEFHEHLRLQKSLSDQLSIFKLDKVLQISMVHVVNDVKMRGSGRVLYQTLVRAGYIIISDNVHYKGGKALWKSLAKSIKNPEVIYVSNNGEIIMKDNSPVLYDGSNIPDEDIWSEDDQKRYVVLIYTKTR